jgi:AAA domain
MYSLPPLGAAVIRTLIAMTRVLKATAKPARKSSPLVCAADVIMRSKDWLWRGHLLRGAQEMFTGTPGIGKSQAHCDLVARTTRGDAWPDGTAGTSPASVFPRRDFGRLPRSYLIASTSTAMRPLPPREGAQ